MTDTHAVYAVLDTDLGMHKVRVSEHVSWDEAIERFYALERDPRENGRERRDPMTGRFIPRLRHIVKPGYTCYNRPVHFFAVRSSDDPEWPAHGAVLSLKSTI